MNEVYSCRFDEAVALAVDAFRHSKRKATGVPYVTHLFSVTALVGECGGDENQMIAAVLHDYLEDIPADQRVDLRDQFGDDVYDMVLALSDTMVMPKPPWRERKESYLAKLGAKPVRTKLVSAADKLHNCRCTVRDFHHHGDQVFVRFRGGKDGTLWYYDQVVQRLAQNWEHPILDELDRTVQSLLATR